jgi:hypothetical protein
MRAGKRFALDVVIRPARFLLQEGQLDEVQRVLRDHAPQWSKQARIWRSREDQKPADLARPGSLEELIREDEARLGTSPMRKVLDAELGPRRSARFLGSAELRGEDDALTVVISVDEYALAPLGSEWIFGNRVSLQVRRSKVEGVDAVAWSAEVFQTLCDGLPSLYGDVHSSAEYDAKNMSREGGGLEAVGVDASKHLPGIYWLNFFGKPYCDLIGRDRLLSAPAAEVREVDDGVLLRLADDPREWASPEYKAVERRVLDHIGPQYFFSKGDPERRTVAPPFGSLRSR